MSAVAAVNVALDAALTDAGLVYYAGTAPPNTDPPYIVSLDDTEDARSYHGQPGNLTRVNLHMFALTKMAVLALYSTAHAALHRQPISVEGAELERGSLRLVAVQHDPITNWFHVIAEYTADSVGA